MISDEVKENKMSKRTLSTEPISGEAHYSRVPLMYSISTEGPLLDASIGSIDARGLYKLGCGDCRKCYDSRRLHQPYLYIFHSSMIGWGIRRKVNAIPG
jgi:hypothetical protein